MSVLTPLGIVIVSVFILSFLTLTPGIFAIFNHYAYGKYSRKKAENLTLYFILGSETISSCLFLSIYLITAVIVADISHSTLGVFTWILTGITIALAIISLFFYFHPSPGTRLFIPRKTANSLIYHAKVAKTRSDAFTLGALSCIPELVFTIPLYFITSAEILRLSATHPASQLLTIIYIVTPTIPLLFTRWQFHHGHNLAQVARSRVHNKTFTRFFLCINYLLIATVLIISRF